MQAKHKMAAIVPSEPEPPRPTQALDTPKVPETVQQKKECEKRDSRSLVLNTATNTLEQAQLGPQVGLNIGRKTLVLDLDETLIHSSFRVVKNADILLSVEIEGELHQVYVRKRPGVDEFLLKVAQWYEIVVYTASMSKYASPLLDQLDIHKVCTWRLYREACTKLRQGYVKDLSRLGRDLKHVIIIDNSPTCYALQPDNAIPIRTWRDDVNDRELSDLIPILSSLADVEDIPQVLKQIVWSCDDDEEDGHKGGATT
jgi:Dullard-like phosphatase family protein